MTPALFVFFFNDPPTTEIYTLSLHDALPICRASGSARRAGQRSAPRRRRRRVRTGGRRDRKSTRLNSSHEWISYAVFCLKKKKKQRRTQAQRYTNRTRAAETGQLLWVPE